MNPQEAYDAQFAGKSAGNIGLTANIGGTVPTHVTAPTTFITPGAGGVLQKVGAVGSQALDLAKGATMALAKYVKNSAVDVGRTTYNAGKTYIDAQTQPIANKILADQSAQLGNIQDKIMADYKSGKMSKENYLKAIDDLSKSFHQNSQDTMKISAGPTPVQRAVGVAETAVNVMSLGSFGLTEVGAKEAFSAGGSEALKALVDEAASPLEKAVMNVPAIRALVERNLSQAAQAEASKVAGESISQFITREGKNVAVDLLIKRPVFYQTNISQAQDLYNGILHKNLGGAVSASAWLGIQMIEGGPLGVISRAGSWAKSGIKTLAKGNLSYIDDLSKVIGSGDANQGAKYIMDNKSMARDAYGKFMKSNAEDTFRIAQELNLRAAGGDVAQAVEQTLSTYDQAGIDRSTITFKQLHTDLNKWASAEASRIAEFGAGKVKGVEPGDVSKYAVVRWDGVMKNGLVSELSKVGEDKGAQMAVLTEMATRPGVGWGNNEILMTRLKNIINENISADEKGNLIKAIETASVKAEGMSNAFADHLGNLGYTIAAPFGGNKIPTLDYGDVLGSTRKLVSAAVDGNTEVFDLAREPQPAFAALANGIQRAGLSPEASSQIANSKLSESLVMSLNENGMAASLGLKSESGRGNVVNGGQAIMSRLQTYLENKRGILGVPRSTVQDIRQMTANEISHALGVSKQDAKLVSRAIVDGYMKVPLEFRGLGGKIADLTYKVNPLQKYYMRIQSALRFTYNPFFQVRADVKTRFAAHAEANNLIWNKSRAQLDTGAAILDKAGILGGTLPDEAAQDQVVGRITASLTGNQRRQVAGLAYDLAEKRGITMEELVKNHYSDVEDVLRTAVQYPRTGFLASPMSRTLNLMFFPMRFNIKIAELSAGVIAKQPPSVQMAIIHSGFKLSSWLKSDEGITWQSTHADALEVFNYITPAHSIEQTLSLLSGHPDGIASLGELGGLPLGFISQILDAEGVIHLNKPYVDPKTGNLLPDYIPKTVKAQASVALVDLLSSMFTYPGATLGLPGKQKTVRSIVQNFIATKGTDFTKELRTEDLTPLQKNWIRVLQGNTDQQSIDKLYNSPAPGQFNWYTLPPLDLPVNRPTTAITAPPRNPAPSGKVVSSRKKTAQPIPQR